MSGLGNSGMDFVSASQLAHNNLSLLSLEDRKALENFLQQILPPYNVHYQGSNQRRWFFVKEILTLRWLKDEGKLLPEIQKILVDIETRNRMQEPPLRPQERRGTVPPLRKRPSSKRSDPTHEGIADAIFVKRHRGQSGYHDEVFHDDEHVVRSLTKILDDASSSHRKLDPVLSLEYRPYHTHDEDQPLTPGEVYELDIEIWPTCIVVPVGYRLALTVRGRDYEWDGDTTGLTIRGFPSEIKGCGAFLHNEPADRPPDVFESKVTLHAGGERSSWLLLPVIPEPDA